jgi:hypothetical protein
MSTGAVVPEAPWRAGLRSARANLLPGFVLQLAALALVTGYYQHAPTRVVLARLVAWRTELGVLSAVITTGFFGGLLPMVYFKFSRATRGHYTAAQVAAVTAFWAYKGVEVELFYRLLARVIGEGHDAATIATKTFIDQFVYCPLLAVPATVVLYEWVNTHFDGRALIDDLKAPRWFYRRMLPVLISNIGVWLPTACIIYSLPTPLQLPLQNLVLCFFTLFVAHQTRRAV